MTAPAADESSAEIATDDGAATEPAADTDAGTATEPAADTDTDVVSEATPVSG